MISKYQFVLLVVNKLLVSGDWVEMPQFSDDSKVYKLSAHDYFYDKFSNNDQKTVTDYDTETISQLLNKFGNTDRNTGGGIPSHGIKNFVHSSEAATINSSNVSNESKDTYDNDDEDDDDDSLNIFTPESELEEILPGDTESSTPALSLTLESPTEEPSVSSTALPILPATKSQTTTSVKENYNNQTTEGVGFHDYLPMEMLKKVHQTLKAQPSTFKGKIRFLKQFEKDLIAEIEARLSTALAPIRRTRGTHDYYDHDEEMGFPSLEGALMAISFLTFAVYLVRLVMLLFRNANNPPTTGATLLFGRKRRSTDTLTQKTEEILNYLNTFDTN